MAPGAGRPESQGNTGQSGPESQGSASAKRPESQGRAQRPQLGVAAQLDPRAQVTGARATAGTRLRANLTLGHQHVSRTPQRQSLIVVDESLGQIPQRAVPLPIVGDLLEGDLPFLLR